MSDPLAKKNLKAVLMPKAEQNGFIPTLNQMGFMTSQLDSFSQEFVSYASHLKEIPVLEIGAAYGIASLRALENGAQVIANDLDARHLEVLKLHANPLFLHNLTLLPGEFPSGISLSSHSVGAVLICRVLHFFNGKAIEKAAEELFRLLKPGGKLFLVADTPYLKVFKEFIPIYEQLRSEDVLWPGLISNLAKYTPNRAPNLPKIFHALDPVILKRVLEKVGFKIEKMELFAQTHYPDDIRLDGREGVGCVAVKP